MENIHENPPFMDDFRLEMDAPYLRDYPRAVGRWRPGGNQVPEVAAMIMISCPIEIIQEPQMINDADSVTAYLEILFGWSVSAISGYHGLIPKKQMVITPYNNLQRTIHHPSPIGDFFSPSTRNHGIHQLFNHY